jgi:hypothetical protein
MCDRQREILYHHLDLQMIQNSMSEQALPLPYQSNNLHSKRSNRLD